MSQKNVFTKVATGLAFGVVGAAIGADLSGITDGLDASGFGDGGVGGGGNADFSDTSAYNGTADAGSQGPSAPSGPDVSASNNQDFSGLQNGSTETTNYMQQQYYQHVQLPNLAGPSMTPAMLNPTI